MSRKPRGRARLSAVGDEQPAGDVSELAALRDQLIAAGAPPEILDVLSTSPDLDVALQRLESAALVPSRREALDVMVNGWSPLLRRGADQLSAEFLATLGTAELIVRPVFASWETEFLPDDQLRGSSATVRAPRTP